MELPESARWHPLRAAKAYENEAEQAAGLYANAFSEYGRLKAEYKLKERRAGQTENALDFMWSQSDIAKACVSDLNTYSVRAQTMAAMAAMKYQRYQADLALAAQSVQVRVKTGSG
jgi:hypothetical protein